MRLTALILTLTCLSLLAAGSFRVHYSLLGAGPANRNSSEESGRVSLVLCLSYF